MKNTIIYIFLIILATSCSDFLDVNEDPTRIGEDNVKMNVLLPTVCEATSAAYFAGSNVAMNVTHHLDNVQAGYYQEFSASSAWDEVYLKALNNIRTLKTLATDENSPHYLGVAQVLEAFNLGTLTSLWENAPYSQALMGAENSSPAFDTQEEIYNTLLSLLENAITNLEQEESDFAPSSDDLFYGGDIEKWIKLANSLKARYLNHVRAKNIGSQAELLEAIGNGFSSNEDDFQLIYNSNFAAPWYNAIAAPWTQTIATKALAGDFVDMMYDPSSGFTDPRLPLITENIDGTIEYIGLRSFITDTLYNCVPTINTWYMQVEGPNLLMSYSELRFIEAEATIDSDPARAQIAYQEGIAAHMDKLGVDAADRDSYLMRQDVASANISNIMQEKYKALVFNLEAWNDMRRVNFDNMIYPKFFEPSEGGRSVPAQRALYPSSEETRNPSNVNANRKGFTEQMWRDM